MRNSLIIVAFLYLYVNVIAAKNPIQSPNNKNDDSTHLNEVKDFNFVFSQKGWRYSTIDSTYVDYSNIIKDTIFLNGDQFIQNNLLQSKFVFTNEEKLKIYIVEKNMKFDLLPNHLELRNIYYFTPEYEQTISIYSKDKNHTVSWDGIYPDLGNNEYVLKHRRLVNRYKELSDIIYSILIKKVELLQLYHKDSRMRNPMNTKGVNLKNTEFPKKYIPKIGKYRWGVTAS